MPVGWRPKKQRDATYFLGNWTPYPKESYYSNETCPFRTDK